MLAVRCVCARGADEGLWPSQRTTAQCGIVGGCCEVFSDYSGLALMWAASMCTQQGLALAAQLVADARVRALPGEKPEG